MDTMGSTNAGENTHTQQAGMMFGFAYESFLSIACLDGLVRCGVAFPGMSFLIFSLTLLIFSLTLLIPGT